MTQPYPDDYQPDERRAIASFEEIGIFGTCSRLEALSNTAQRRWAECFQKNGSIPVGYAAIDFLMPEERSEHHILRLSLTLCVDESKNAHARILARRQLMKQKRVSATK